MLNVELIEQVEKILRELGVSNRSGVEVVDKLGRISDENEQLLNKLYINKAKKIALLQYNIPEFMTLYRKSSPEDHSGLIMLCNDDGVYNQWYKVLAKVIGRDPMSLSLVWSGNETNRDWMSTYLVYTFKAMTYEINTTLARIVAEGPPRVTKVKFAEKESCCTVDAIDERINRKLAMEEPADKWFIGDLFNEAIETF